MMGRHETVTLVDRWDEDVEIDTGIAPLIQACWDNDLWTWNSCEENFPGIAWIQFEHQSAEMFLTLVAEFDPEYDEMWDYRACVLNVNEEIIDDEVVPIGAPQYIITVSIRFPTEWIPELTACLNKHILSGGVK